MTDEPAERPFDRAWLERVLRSAGGECVLVGGQALAFWADYFGIAPLPAEREDAYLTRDADFLGTRDSVLAIAHALRGRPHFPHQRALTSLAGQIAVAAGGGTQLNIDVLHHLLGPSAAGVRRRAQEVRLGKVGFSVMHPIDVLHSRIENLAKLKDKQTAEGIAQARLGVRIAHAYVLDATRVEPGGQRQALRAIERIVEIAKSGAGRKALRKFSIPLRDAIPAEAITSRSFREVRWPRLVLELTGSRKRAGGDSSA